MFGTNKSFKKSKAKNLNLKCTHYGGQGHLVKRCFELICYPEKRNFAKQKSNKFVNNAKGVQTKFDKIVGNSTGLTPEVIEQLLKLVNVQNSERSSRVNMTGVCASVLNSSELSFNWIIDS